MNKLKQILKDQIQQGATPELIARSIAAGFTLGLIPILGTTTVLCLLAGVIFRLNHPAIQITHHIIYPLQLLIFIPYWRAGEWLFDKAPVPLNVSEIISLFKHHFTWAFKHYALTALAGGVVWLITTPIIYGVIYFVTKKVLSYKPTGFR